MKKKVQVRTWKDMADEYGVDEYGNITVHDAFTRTMEERMPLNRIIVVEPEPYDDAKYTWTCSEGVYWTISSEMCEEEITEKVVKDLFKVRI